MVLGEKGGGDEGPLCSIIAIAIIRLIFLDVSIIRIVFGIYKSQQQASLLANALG